MTKKRSKNQPSPAVFEELEPRLLLSADIGEGLVLLSDELSTISAPEIEIVQKADDSEPADSDVLLRRELVFMDTDTAAQRLRPRDHGAIEIGGVGRCENAESAVKSAVTCVLVSMPKTPAN